MDVIIVVLEEAPRQFACIRIADSSPLDPVTVIDPLRLIRGRRMYKVSIVIFIEIYSKPLLIVICKSL